MIEQYYTILGVENNVTIPDLKRAYRKRAKELHPDINKSDRAHEEFILLNEAFEYLYNLKSGKVYHQIRKEYTRNSTSKKNSYEDWCRTERENTRARARYYAQMRYEAYIKSDYYKVTVAIDTLVDLINLITSIFILLLPVLGYIKFGTKGLIVGGVAIIVTISYWVPVLLTDKPKLNIKEIIRAIIIILKSSFFRVACVTVLNIYLFLSIGFSTLINTMILSSGFLLPCLVGCFIYKIVLKRNLNWIVVVGILPGILNLFLVVNYAFSGNRQQETYALSHQYDKNVAFNRSFSFKKTSEFIETTAVTLENDKYSEYYGIRVFLDFERMKNANKITYYFEDGLLGFRVLKDYNFCE